MEWPELTTTQVGADGPSSVEPPKAVASRALSLISLERLEQEVKASWSEGQVAWVGPKGDGWTYAENRRAFDDFPIMPRRLQGHGEELPDVRMRLLDHELALPVIASPIGSQGYSPVTQNWPQPKALA